MEALSLLELNQQIQEVLHGTFNETYWVTAEISELKENRNGHCYLELVEKEEQKDKILAKMRGIIWANIYRMLKPHFLDETGREFDAGLKVLVRVSIVFHELYGLSLQISDIDPTYTLGDIARRRQEILQQLEEDGIIDMNKEVELPLVPQRIAVISSQTAAGYQDFCNQLEANSYGYQVHYTLFEAFMQGNTTESSIIQALEQINETLDHFDAVAIIRGGGSRSDLSYFDSYELAANIAQFPLPVLTGIGHEKDESIADRVAHTSLKTPTAVAEFLLERFAAFEAGMNETVTAISRRIGDFLTQQQQLLAGYLYRTSAAYQQQMNVAERKLDQRRNQVLMAARNQMHQHTHMLHKMHQQLFRFSQQYTLSEAHRIAMIPQKLRSAWQQFFMQQEHQQELVLSRMEANNPEALLKKGYTLTLRKGAIVKSVQKISEADVLETRFSDGKAISTVTRKISEEK